MLNLEIPKFVLLITGPTCKPDTSATVSSASEKYLRLSKQSMGKDALVS